jgi:hypothetical protein
MKKKKKHYIDKDRLNKELSDFYFKSKEAKEKGIELPRIPEFVGECICKICNELGNKYNFVRYTYKDEMIGDAIVACVKGVWKFNPEKPPYRSKSGIWVEPGKNAFNYISTIAWRAFILKIGNEKREQYRLHSNFLKNYYRIDETGEEINSEMLEVSNRIVSEYEEKLKKKKEK